MNALARAAQVATRQHVANRILAISRCNLVARTLVHRKWKWADPFSAHSDVRETIFTAIFLQKVFVRFGSFVRPKWNKWEYHINPTLCRKQLIQLTPHTPLAWSARLMLLRIAEIFNFTPHPRAKKFRSFGKVTYDYVVDKISIRITNLDLRKLKSWEIQIWFAISLCLSHEQATFQRLSMAY